MPSLIEKLMIIPAILFFVVAAFFGLMFFQYSDSTNLFYATVLFVIGVFFVIIGIISWIISSKAKF